MKNGFVDSIVEDILIRCRGNSVREFKQVPAHEEIPECRFHYCRSVLETEFVGKRKTVNVAAVPCDSVWSAEALMDGLGKKTRTERMGADNVVAGKAFRLFFQEMRLNRLAVMQEAIKAIVRYGKTLPNVCHRKPGNFKTRLPFSISGVSKQTYDPRFISLNHIDIRCVS